MKKVHVRVSLGEGQAKKLQDVADMMDSSINRLLERAIDLFLVQEASVHEAVRREREALKSRK